MSAEPGWYYYEGDPQGTVRRWNGLQWIGFPTPLVDSEPAEAVAPRRRQPFPNQRRLLPFAILGAAGLIATVVTGLRVLSELIDERQRMSESGLTRMMVPALHDPVTHASTYAFGIAAVGGGLLFLLWLFLAHRNLGGRAVGPPEIRNDQFNVWRTLFTPMFFKVENLMEQSDGRPDEDTLSPFGPFLWLALWIASTCGGAFVVATVIPANREVGFSDTFLLVVIGFLAAHLLSLLLALKFLVQITRLQDRRLEPLSIR